jgi:hypothetical protein
MQPPSAGRHAHRSAADQASNGLLASSVQSTVLGARLKELGLKGPRPVLPQTTLSVAIATIVALAMHLDNA